MAKTSVKARQKKRKMVAQYAESVEQKPATGNHWMIFQRNSSKVRLKNRCAISGRPKGFVRYFGISRIALRDMALDGKIPGLRKASW